MKIFKLSLFLLHILAFHMYAEKPSIQEIEAKIEPFLDRIFDSDITRYGFKTGDEKSQCHLSELFQIKYLKTELGLELKKKKRLSIDDVEQNNESERWYAFLLVKDEARAIVTIAFINGNYQIAEIRPERETRALFHLFNKHKGLRLYKHPGTRLFLFHLPEFNNYNLTIIDNRDQKDFRKNYLNRIPQKYSTAKKSIEIVRSKNDQLKLNRKAKGGKR
ncbi:MAG: hypothetical protein GF401_13535 [Chitinivibrionales bacterium]|nr:hypothetical protein [Chitinivibrionales bacterium]